MPIYAYRCDKCNSTAESIETMADSDKSKICTMCGGNMVRLYDYNGFILKGDGWFKQSQGTWTGHDPQESKKNRATKIK